MTKFAYIRKFIILVIVCLLADKALFFLLNRDIEANFDWRLNKVIQGKVNTEVLIIGSSRGARGIIASDIESKLKMKTLNLCYPGSNVVFHDFVLTTYLKYNRKPKIVVLSVDDDLEFVENPWLGYRVDVLYPLTKNDYINDILIERKENSRYSKYFNIPRLRKIHLNFGAPKLEKTDSILPCGSMPIRFRNKEAIFGIRDTNIVTYNKTLENSFYVDSYLHILKTCEKENIKVYLAIPPNYKPMNPTFIARLKELTPKNVKAHIYNQSEKRYCDSLYFYDLTHLRRNGAKLYTKELADFLFESENK